jgi:hypothetical protein
MMDEIPMSLLPPTFQDAIKVSRSVGIGLLWIDSLCILQAGKGSVDDWKEHAISMRKIYANGVLNISADQAFSAEGGFLHSRDPRKIQSITTAYSTLPNSVYQIVDLELTRAYLAESPIAERAWVLQERVLSSRVLHFTSRQLFWECNQLPLACETYPLGIPNFSDQQRLTMAAFNFDRTIGKARVEWYRLLEDYARRKLTYPNKDKLAALAGIVEKLQSGANEQYIAGIFRFDIPFALMWCVKPYTPDLSLPTSSSLRGPSWSWVSQDHPITYEAATLIHDEYNAKGQEIASIAELMELSPLPLQSKTPMVQLCAARLVLRAQTHRVEWDSQTQAQHLDLGLQFRFPDAKSDIECVGTLDNPILNMPCPKEVIAVVLVKATAQFALFKEAGLFLVPDDSLDLRCYRRVGFWWTAFNKGGPDGLPNTKVVTITII